MNGSTALVVLYLQLKRKEFAVESIDNAGEGKPRARAASARVNPVNPQVANKVQL
jgi:hypothetical protein